jgi:hypothetical protein
VFIILLGTFPSTALLRYFFPLADFDFGDVFVVDGLFAFALFSTVSSNAS